MLKRTTSTEPPRSAGAKRPADRSLAQIVAYDMFRMAARLTSVLFLRMRCKGRENIPAAGAALVCANHQSLLDPPLIGLAFDRRLNYLARQSLFKSRLLGAVIHFLDAIPIDRDGSGLAGLKETLRRLKRDELVLIFPEGTRSRDGEVSPLKPGFVAVARRSRAPLLPVGLDGAFDALPPGAVLPRPRIVHLVIGKAITPEEADALDDKALVAELESRIRKCHAEARNGRRR
ncbi:MAG: lysophospholipid acyltransferase family protein [Pirellulaceae bacterium]